jgi:predicted AAA+ superfamily ATPase
LNVAKLPVILQIMYIKRHAENVLRDLLGSGKVGLVLGARQVGKTTLVERVLADGAHGAVRFLNFDVEVDKALFRAAAALPPAGALEMLAKWRPVPNPNPCCAN